MKIKTRSIFVVICLISFIQPNFIVKIAILNTISIIATAVCFTILIVKSIKNNVKVDLTFYLLLAWRFFIFVPTVIRNGELIKWGYQSVVFCGLYLLIKNYINNEQSYKVAYKVICVYILINIIMMIILPKGIFPEYGIYFLGIRTRFTEYSVALLYMSIFYYINYTDQLIKDKRKLIISVLIALLNIISQWVVTAIVVCTIILLLYIVLRKIERISLIYSIGFVIFIVLTINLINGNLLNSFSWLFTYLNRDITLTGRTIIWSNAMNAINNYMPFGYGYVNDGNIIMYANGYWQCHNTLLQMLIESGIFGTISFYALFYISGKTGKNKHNSNNFSLQMSTMFGFLIMMMTEITYYYSIFIFVILLMSNSNVFINNKEKYYDKK